MRIALFYNLHFGGAKRAAYEQVKRLVERGHTVDVYTTDPYQDIFDLKSSSSSFNYYRYETHNGNIPFLSRFIKDLEVFIKYKNLHKVIAKDIDSRNYDIVICHPDVITQAPYLTRYLQTKNAYYCQEPLRIAYEYILRPSKNIGNINYLYELLTRSIRKKVDLFNVRSATYTIASCYHVRERMIEAYGVWSKISYLGVDEKLFLPNKAQKKQQVVFFGNKEEYNNGYDLAKQAISLLPKKYNLKLVVVPWRRENNKRLTDKELVGIYNKSLATFSLSRFETFGLTPIESMSCATPVIATNVSGHRETVKDGEGGYLVDFDPGEIADKITQLFENDKLRTEMGKKGREHIENEWTWDKRIVEFENLLEKLIKDEEKKN